MPLKVKKVTGPTIAASVLFNGSNQYLSLPASSNWAMTGNFTVECWVNTNLPSGGSGTILSLGSNSSAYAGLRFQINRASSGATPVLIEVLISTSGGSWGLTGQTSALMVAGIWNHVAVVRSGGVVTVYINGVGYNIGTINGTLYAGPYNAIGKLDGYSDPFYYNGYISNLRILNGTALYTASFTAPTAPLTAIANTSLLTCHDTTIRDASTNNFTITNNNTATVSTVAPFTAVLASSMKFKKTITTRIGRSVLFDGTNQYLSLPNAGALNLGSNNFTIEAWVYPTSVSGNKNIFYINGNASSYSAICLYIQNSKFAFLANQTGGYPWTLQIGEVGPTISSNTWYHVATTRSGNSFYVFVNGTLVSGAPYSLSGALFNGTINSIGYQDSMTSNNFPGYISNARIINGTALYTASFSVPTAPLTAIANTSLLTCNAPTIVDASSNNFTITNNNTATVSTTNPFGADTVSGTFKVKKSAGVYMVATGGDLVTTSGSYKVHTFKTVGTSSFVVSSLGSTPTIECLIVGGGGGGGGRAMGGGGGGGGVIYTSSALLATGSFSAIIGAGGIAATGMATSTGKSGGNTLFTYNGITTTALGGGGGGTEGYAALSGGNGGGGHDASGVPGSGSAGGFPGGSGSVANYLSNGCGGGGGGAGGAGVAGVAGTGGNGGIGAIYNITGSAYYGGGGGGGGNAFRSATAGAGGLGGGGLGGRTSPGTAGTANTGGGGGGGGYNGTTGASETNGGDGGSGIILIKYRYTD